EEDAAAGGGLCQGEGPGRAELVLERHGADFAGVVRRLRRPRYVPADLALLLAGEIRLAVAEILHDRRQALRNDAVVVALPAGILLEGFSLEDGLRLIVGRADSRANCQRDQQRSSNQAPHRPRPPRPPALVCFRHGLTS